MEVIAYLADYPEAAPIVAAWLFREWGHRRPGTDVGDWATKFAGFANFDRLPLAVVALRDGAPIATASLVEFDDPGDELGPWVSSVYVVPEQRGHGLATQLTMRIEAEAIRLGFARLLLGASVPPLYASLGFAPTGGRKHGEPLMEKWLPPLASSLARGP